jgi:para-aminobenzoate synthetase component 1
MRYSVHKSFPCKKSAQELFLNFKNDRLPFLLESSLDVDGMGRYSFFGSEPFLVFSANGGRSLIEEGGGQKVCENSTLEALRGLLRTYGLRGKSRFSIPFLCGAVGFFSYDFGFSLEDIRRKNVPDPVVPEVMFGFYDTVVCLDHKKGEVTVFSSGFPEQGRLRPLRAEARLEVTLKKFNNAARLPDKIPAEAFIRPADLSSNFTRNGYLVAVERAKEYIAAGDIYQVNLSQRFQARLAILDDWLLYQRLVRNFPVSFSAFFKTKDFSILSASPEKFLSFDGRVAVTRPMKGTRKRTKDARSNQRLKNELIHDEKEKAELLMIVDLERNDLGRACAYGSIRVKSLRKIEAYSNVFQATAEIQGVLHKTKDRLDLIKGCFPGGSVTGCPKIRAMEVIEELEPVTRGIYTGSLGYLSFHNTLEFNVLIRSFLKKHDQVTFHAGGGIVTDSRPAFEYQETLVKARALKDALIGV